MSLSKLFTAFVTKDDVSYQDKFKLLTEDLQIVIYQKLLFKAGGKDASEQEILDSLNEPEFQITLSTEVQDGIKIEQQRYAVAKANALYQDYLYQKALARVAHAKQEDLLFDLQGRLVYQLTLTIEEQEEVLKKIEAALSISNVARRNSHAVKGELKKLLGGRTPTDTTLCSIDLMGKEPTIGSEAYKRLKDIYEEKYGATKAIHSHQRASIVASFEETYAHMCLMARTYEHRSRAEDFDLNGKRVNSESWQDIRQKAALKIQERVAVVYKVAVANATDSKGDVDVEKVNKSLVKERKSLAHFAKKALIEEVVAHLKLKNYGRAEVLEYMQNLCKRLDKKHTFTAQTATGYDYFYTSDYLQQGMLITGTHDTAHNKPKFKQNSEDQAAYRRVTYTYRDQDGALQPTSAVSARMPSPALVFDERMTPDQIKKDLKEKYGFLHEEMRAMRGGKQGPVVENLFTSFHSYAFERTVDWGNNRQRTSVLYMIQAMHEFNAQQKNDNYLYVQNIGTNRHTRDLGYRVERGLGSFTGSVELDDITLSAEMAMLHTLQENSAYLSSAIRKQIIEINQRVLEHYRFFLQQENRPKYFAESDAGLSLIGKIGKFKKQLGQQLKKRAGDADDLPSLASNALAKMIATNDHWDIRYGQLSQALSMYLEWASTGGCKSGNERNQDVMLRFALLKSIHERVEHAGNMNDLQGHEKEIYKQLKAYAKGHKADPDALRAAISISVSKCNLHGGAASISREDQGGAAKLNSFSYVQDFKNPFGRWFARVSLGIFALATFPLLIFSAVRTFYISQLIDTNNAADREMNLDALGASKTQAHKGQDEQTRDAMLEVLEKDKLFVPKTLSKAEKSGFEQDKKLCEALYNEEIHLGPPFIDSPMKMTILIPPRTGMVLEPISPEDSVVAVVDKQVDHTQQVDIPEEIVCGYQ